MHITAYFLISRIGNATQNIMFDHILSLIQGSRFLKFCWFRAPTNNDYFSVWCSAVSNARIPSMTVFENRNLKSHCNTAPKIEKYPSRTFSGRINFQIRKAISKLYIKVFIKLLKIHIRKNAIRFFNDAYIKILGASFYNTGPRKYDGHILILK